MYNLPSAYGYVLSNMRGITLFLMHILIQSLSSYKSSFSYKTSDDAETHHQSTYATSVKNISVRAEWLCQRGRPLSEPSETPRWWITPRLASIPLVTLHIATRSQFCRFFSLCWSPILKERSGVVAYCDHTSEWVHWVHAFIEIAMRWVKL